jgi:hypothetical protein
MELPKKLIRQRPVRRLPVKERGDSSNSQASWPAHIPEQTFAGSLGRPRRNSCRDF